MNSIMPVPAEMPDVLIVADIVPEAGIQSYLHIYIYYQLEKLTQVHHAGVQGRGSPCFLQMSHKHLGRRLVSKAPSRLVIQMTREMGEIAL
jgi:hypothetical protein